MGTATRYEPADSYLRLQLGVSQPTIVEGLAPRAVGALTFVDLDARPGFHVDELIAAFQVVPQRLIPSKYLLIRWPMVSLPERAADDDIAHWLTILSDRARALPERDVAVAIVQFLAGGRPQVHWWAPSHGDERPPDSVLLARAREAEVHTLLVRGNAIWQPTTYHYRLPSGIHDRAFVRVADAIRSPRDAVALATWLTPHIKRRSGLFFDSSTLTPVILGLQAMAREVGIAPGPAAALEDYPRTRLELNRAARVAAGEGGSVTGLLSVSSSGHVAQAMAEAMRLATGGDEWSLDILVDKQGSSAIDVIPSYRDAGSISVWLGMKRVGLQSERAGSCTACADSETARIIQIDPRNFGAMALAEPELVVPSVQAAADSSAFWTVVDSAGALGVQAAPQDSTIWRRPKGSLLGIRILLDQLVAHCDLAPAVERRFTHFRKGETSLSGQLAGRLVAMENPHFLTAPRDDADLLEQHPHLFDVIRQDLRIEAPLQVFDPGPNGPDLEVQSGQKGIVIVLGSFTGWTLRQFQQALADKGVELHALILHARPATPREWQSMENVFSQRLVALWRTYLPWWSPLEEELELVSGFLDEGIHLSPAVWSFLQERRWFCAPSDDQWDWSQRVVAFEDLPTDDPRRSGSWSQLAEFSDRSADRIPPVPYDAVLWGQPPRGKGRRRIRGESLYGRDLGPLATYAAVGAAVHHTRMTTRVRAAPQWPMFEIPAMGRSYFDGPLVACMLRWIKPQEAWWGATPADVQDTVADLLQRFVRDPEDLRVLLPEVLLAAAHGKLPAAAVEGLLDITDSISSDWDESSLVPVEAARKLLQWVRVTGQDQRRPG